VEPILSVHFRTQLGTKCRFMRDPPAWGDGGFIDMLGRLYLVRQIRTLLNFAKQTSDPLFAAFLMEKAVHLKSQIEESPPARDISPAAPDVEPENRSR
jgi:hypothetical protein